MQPFRTEHFANGITLYFVDRSNRYFGDYHRVHIEIRLSVPLSTGTLSEVRHRERMAVPGAEVEVVRDRLADDFLRHAGRYLARADYPARLAAAAAAPCPLAQRR
jgi:hypothetical protein